MNYDFAKRVDDLLRRERRTKKSLYEHLNMSSQGFDAMMRNNSFTASRLGDVANFFGISIAEFYTSEMSDNKEKQEVTGGDAYLQDHLVSLEANFKKLLEQLQVKDQQIAGLQRTVDALVGKSESATVDPLFCDEVDMVDIEAMLSQYKLSALQSMSGLFTAKPSIIQKPSLVKVVALS